MMEKSNGSSGIRPDAGSGRGRMRETGNTADGTKTVAVLDETTEVPLGEFNLYAALSAGADGTG